MTYILLALLNGIFISVSRVLIGRLSFDVGPFKASFWSYVVGFLFISIVFVVMGRFSFMSASEAPFFAYLGGLFGALYVVINSYAFTKLGATNTVILVISGQMISGVLFDYQSDTFMSTLAQFGGIAMIVTGIYIIKKNLR